MTELAEIARNLFASSLKTVDLSRSVSSQISINADSLVLAGSVLPLSEVDEVITIAVGKAAASMYSTAKELFRPVHELRHRGMVIAPAQHKMDWPNTQFFAGEHPIPGAVSANAARAVLALLKTVTARSIVVFLVSGGASAMLEQAIDPSISLPDIAAFYGALITSGLSIARMNALRKHVSAVKGGRLAQAASAARLQLTLLVSDVPASTPDSIGSGPTLPDSTTLADCLHLLDEFGPHSRIPQSIQAFLRSPHCPETPRANAPIFSRSVWRTILSSEDLAEAAAIHARAAGFHVEIDNHCDEWEYRRGGAYLLERSRVLAQRHPRSCLISVGEISVELPPNPGVGGRNGHFALWCATQAAMQREAVTILSAGSDGIDGNSSAAGAVCDQHTVHEANQLGLSVEKALEEFNTAPLLDPIGASILCGPTGNNLRDLRLLLRSS